MFKKTVQTISYTFLLFSAFTILFPSQSQAAVTSYISNEVGNGSNTQSIRSAVDDLDNEWYSDVTELYQCNGENSTLITRKLLNDSFDGTNLVVANGVSVHVQVVEIDSTQNMINRTSDWNSKVSGCGNSSVLQESSPRPQSLVNNSCYVNELLNAEAGNRIGFLFSFSNPVSAFGTWFGDLETRNPDVFGGALAFVKYYNEDNDEIGNANIATSTSNQSLCGSTNSENYYVGCGNKTTRWIGFLADDSTKVSKMLVIVGDDDTVNSTNIEDELPFEVVDISSTQGIDENISFIGPTLVTANVCTASTSSDSASSAVTATSTLSSMNSSGSSTSSVSAVSTTTSSTSQFASTSTNSIYPININFGGNFQGAVVIGDDNEVNQHFENNYCGNSCCNNCENEAQCSTTSNCSCSTTSSNTSTQISSTSVSSSDSSATSNSTLSSVGTATSTSISANSTSTISSEIAGSQNTCNQMTCQNSCSNMATTTVFYINIIGNNNNLNIENINNIVNNCMRCQSSCSSATNSLSSVVSQNTSDLTNTSESGSMSSSVSNASTNTVNSTNTTQVANTSSLTVTTTSSGDVAGTQTANTNSTSGAENVCLNTNLNLIKSHIGNFVKGQSGTFTLSVSNYGPNVANGPIIVNDTLPLGMQFLSYAGNGWVCGAVGQNVTCTRNSSMQLNEVSQININVSITNQTQTTSTNVASVYFACGDLDPANNTSSDTVTVTNPAVLGVTDTGNGDGGAILGETGASSLPNLILSSIIFSFGIFLYKRQANINHS